jgi:hypothetical protein
MSWYEVIESVNRGFVGEAVPGAPISTPTFADTDAEIAALPARARERLLTLKERAADARAAVEAAMDSRDQAWRDCADMERQLRTLQNPHSRGGFQRPPSDLEVQRAEGKPKPGTTACSSRSES